MCNVYIRAYHVYICYCQSRFATITVWPLDKHTIERVNDDLCVLSIGLLGFAVTNELNDNTDK